MELDLGADGKIAKKTCEKLVKIDPRLSFTIFSTDDDGVKYVSLQLERIIFIA